MRIIFILDNLYPNGMASSARVRSYGKGFVSNGIDVQVLLPVPRQVHSKAYINPSAKGVDENGVIYKYMAGTSMRNKNILLRKIQDFYGYSLTLIHILFQSKKDDFIILYEGPIWWHKLCIAMAHLAGVKIGIELNELPYGTGKETVQAKQKRNIMLKEVFPKLDFVLAISAPLAELVSKYAPNVKVIKVPILSEEYLEGDDFLEEPPLYLFHSGSLSEQKDGICGMLEAFGIASRRIKKNIFYILTRTLEQSPHAQDLKNIIEKYHIQDKVKFLGYVDVSTLRKYQKKCFLTIINKYDTQQNKYCFSTKLAEYLSFSRPVITTTVGEANVYLKDSINAFIVPPNHPELIAEKIVYAIGHPEEAEKIGKEGHKLIEKEFNSVCQTRRIISFLKKKFRVSKM